MHVETKDMTLYFNEFYTGTGIPNNNPIIENTQNECIFHVFNVDRKEIEKRKSICKE